MGGGELAGRRDHGMPSQISADHTEGPNSARALDLAAERAAERAATIARLDRYASLLDTQRENRELTELIVHDLKAPLSIVRAGLEWVGGHLRPDQLDVADAVADAYAAADRLSGMIGDMLTVSQLDGGGMALSRRAVDVPVLFERLGRAYARRAREKSIVLATRPFSDPAAPLEVQ